MNISEVIKIASTTRSGLPDSIGFGEPVMTDDMPESLESVYSVVSGTKGNIKDRTLMDLIPGYRLININELKNETKSFHDLYKHLDNFTPFMADFSSAYVVINEKDGSIYRVSPDYEETKVACNLDKFWETVYKCYESNAYYLDSDGYLDYDFDKEGQIGLSINPECEYWNE